jgi:hypothetical protein
MERKLNFGCLVVILALAVLFSIAMVYLGPDRPR